MAKIGYLYLSSHFATLDEDKVWMQNYGCVRIVEEQHQDEKERPQWQNLLSKLGRGDEIVVSRLSNAVRGIREMSIFFEICRIQSVRIISIHDCIDTADDGSSLFPGTTIKDVIDTMGSLPADILAMRKAEEHVRRLTESPRKKSESYLNREKREQLIVRMYNSGHTIEDIWKASGFRSRSSVFRILNKYNASITRQRNIK